ncbi:MAG: ParB/RepB/Spo0J family partition protein, partial [Bacteroidales bacterium]
IQPVSLRQMEDRTYQLIAGERRYRAARLAGLKEIPAYIRTVEDESMVEMALIENIQREDLNAVEIALTFHKLIEQYNLTQERLSERIGKKRTTIANYLRLLKLPAEIQMGLKNKIIDMGHARALLSIDDAVLQLKIYEQIKENNYSVRKVEELAKNISGATAEQHPDVIKNKKETNKTLESVKKQLSSFFGTKIQFTCDDKGKGKITIPFKGETDLERIMAIFDKL